MDIARLTLVAFQDAPATGLTPREGWIAGVAAVVPMAVLFWREFTKSRAEREATTIAGYKDLYEQQTANVVKHEATIARLGEESGRLKDLLSAERVAKGSLEIELKYAKQELAERDAADQSRRAGGGG